MVYTLIVLSGGQGSRLGGVDKGLLNVAGESFVQRLIQRLAHPEGDVVVSANRHLDVYARHARVVTDLRDGFQGPLAGIEAALTAVQPDRPVIIVPADMPELPAELPVQMLSALERHNIVTVHDGSRQQPLCLAFYPSTWQSALARFLDSGGRSIKHWLNGKPIKTVQFDTPDAFRNVNEVADLGWLQHRT